jgi:hypothetical protein
MRNGKNGRSGDLLGDVVKGAIAGFAGTMVMGKITTFMYQHEDPEARQRYQEVTGGKYPPQRTAEFVEEKLDLDLSEKQHKMLAKGSHQMVGIGAGITYALARQRIDWADKGQGLLFGALFSLIFDETLTPLMGFAEPPKAYPWQAHARGFVGHLAFGLTADTVLDMLDAVA